MAFLSDTHIEIIDVARQEALALALRVVELNLLGAALESVQGEHGVRTTGQARLGASVYPHGEATRCSSQCTSVSINLLLRQIM